ncbi:MAG: hypothetical protein KAR40_16455 [Candidatus Sabulitectum sp.]|nr:hypothetical protein [Candidatus Sabulitectum sp.]
MPQMQLPLIPTGATIVNTRIHVQEQQDYWYYFLDGSPIYSHHKTDTESFKMFTSSLVCVNRCKQVDIVNSFGVTKSLVSRNATLYAEKGPAGFFEKRKGHGGTVLTKQVLEKAQHLLNLGSEKHHVADMLGVKYDTLRKAVSDGRLSVNPSIAKKN